MITVIETGILEMRADTVSDEILEGHFRAMEAWAANNTEPVGFLVTLAAVLEMSAAQRRRFADFQVRMQEHDRRLTVGVALCAPNAIVRGFVTAVYWLKSPVYPHRFVQSRAEGLQWLREQLAKPERRPSSAPP